MAKINIDKILLAFFDIQAYSDFVRKNPKNHCLEKAENLFKDIKKDMGGSHILDIRLRHWIFSDSIIMIPDVETHPLDIAVIDFLIAMCSGLMFRGILEGLPLRGAIGTGYFYKNDDIIVSSALVDAATYEKEQNWLGAVITPSALSLINEIHPGFENEYKSLLNFGRFLDKGKIPWTNSKHEPDIPKPEYSFYVKPIKLYNTNWRKRLPDYFEINSKVSASDLLYGAESV